MIPENEADSNWDNIMVTVVCSELVEYIFDKTSKSEKNQNKMKGILLVWKDPQTAAHAVMIYYLGLIKTEGTENFISKKEKGGLKKK